MKLIWNDLLHANFRYGRMYGGRAEHLAANCTVTGQNIWLRTVRCPLAVHECVPECDVDRIALNCVCPVRFCITHRDFLYHKIILKVQIER